MPHQEIKAYLADNGIKLSWLADKLGIRIAKLSQILNGNAPLHAHMLYKICDILRVPCEAFRPK